VSRKRRLWAETEINVLKSLYSDESRRDFSIKSIAKALRRTFAAVALKASRLKLTVNRNDRRQFSSRHIQSISRAQLKRGAKPSEKARRSVALKKLWATRGHPRGMLGKHHTYKTRSRISVAHSGRIRPRSQVIQAMKTRLLKYGTLANPRPATTWRQGWRTIGGNRIYFRSRWEANYARHLELLKASGEVLLWEHEPETFWFEGIRRGCVSYLPDFRVTLKSGEIEYHEVKGWMDPASKTKLKRMRKYHPSVVVVLIDTKRYRAISKTASRVIRDWEAK